MTTKPTIPNTVTHKEYKEALKMAKFYFPDRHKDFEGKMWSKYHDVVMEYRRNKNKPRPQDR